MTHNKILVGVFSTALLLGQLGDPWLAAAGPPERRASLKTDVCYQVVTDRFFDGDPNNNDPLVSKGLFDPSKKRWKHYWGGDFAGIAEKAPYLKRLGVTTVWISPPVDNINKVVVYKSEGKEDVNTGYHGYWARDFRRPEEHFGTWKDFDTMRKALHENGIKLTIDFAPNHTSPSLDTKVEHGEQGLLLSDGEPIVNYLDDAKNKENLFHHNGGIEDWDDRYQTQYRNMVDLADLAQGHPFVDKHLRDAIGLWLDKGIDGIRVDAVKHLSAGWQKAWADSIFAQQDVFMFGEWYQEKTDNPLYDDSRKYANRTGISLLDFPLAAAIRDTFAADQSMGHLWGIQQKLDKDFDYKENLVTFVDNHDMPRFLTLRNDRPRLHQALAFIFTSRGTPCVNYGTEQYIHDDTEQMKFGKVERGTDPYNRPAMPAGAWSEDTVAFRLIGRLAQLRREEPAIAFGTTTMRWITNDIAIYERQFFDEVVVVAINKGAKQKIEGLLTALPAGAYESALAKLDETILGVPITVADGDGDRKVASFDLPAGAISIWHSRPGSGGRPKLGSVMPPIAREGNRVMLEGRGFGAEAGTVRFGEVAAKVEQWSDDAIFVRAPDVGAGFRPVTVVSKAGARSNEYRVEVLSAPQAAITFRVTGVPPGGMVYLAGNVPELGSWQTTASAAVGPLLHPEGGVWFTTASVPVGIPIQLKFFQLGPGGAVTFQPGDNRQFVAKSTAAALVEFKWNP